MERLRFYLYYSLRHMGREKQRTAFALFCVAAGVAAIVGLQTLGSLVADELTGNAQAVNRGDVAVGPARYVWFTEEQMAAFEQLVSDGLATDWTQRRFQDGLAISLPRDKGPESFFFLSAFLVDPAVYPFYGQVLALDPANASLAELLVYPDDIVVSENLADRLDIAVGDQLSFKEWSTLYTVRGIVPTGSAVWSKNLGPLADGFFYLEYETTVNAWERDWTATEVFFTTKDEAAATALAERAAEIAPLSPVNVAADKLAQNKRTVDAINKLMLVVGLLAMLVGGIGIANTMQVVVARRRLETAVLKAVGLKGRHVTWLFLTEAALLGLGGSIAGLLLGLGLSRGLVGLTQTFLSNPVHWQIYFQPLVTGLGVGIVATVIFGFLPTLAAAHIRPSQVLRPAGGELPRVGCAQSLLVVVVMTGVLGVLAGQLLGSRVGGLMSAFLVLILLAVLTGMLRIVVWLIEKLPSMGWVSLRLAQRGLGRNRSRAASTLLALIVGLFSISLIVILAANVLSSIREIAAESLGADLQILVRGKASLETVLQTLETSQEVQSFAQVSSFEAELTAINGDPDAREGRIAAYEHEQETLLTSQSRDRLDECLAVIMGRDLSANLPHFAIEPGMGRNFTPDDRQRPVAIVMNSYSLAPLKLQLGDTLTFRLNGNEEITLEIIGVVEEQNTGWQNDAVIAPLDTLMAQATPRSYALQVNVDPHRKDKAVTALKRSLPEGAFVIETDTMLATYNRVFQQVMVLPLLVAAVALFAAATMIANTAALAVIERRREIGVMKAVGIKGRRILGQLLLESSILGLVGGLISVGLVMLPWILISEELGVSSNVNLWPVLKLLALAVGVTLAATFITAWPASRRRPLEVLRHE